MRRVSIVFLLLLAPVVDASVAQVRIAEDAAGDASIQLAGAQQPEPTSPALDLRWLDIVEEVDGFWFTIAVGSLERPGNDISPAATLWDVSFRHGEQGYLLRFIWGIDGGWRTDMYRIDGRSMSGFSDAEIVRDHAAGTISSFVERDLLRDADGAPPTGGHSFTDVFVTASGAQLNDFLSGGDPLVSASDRMPDAGSASYNVSWGARSDGPVALTSDLPFRVSNGAATTYLFELDAVNLDDEVHRFEFAPPTLPQGWSIRFPVASAVLEPGQNRTLPVLVSLPFAHSHGSIQRVTVELRSDTPGVVGRAEIGVLFLEVPQPSGHHPRLWLHSHEQVLIEDVAWHFAYTPGADVYMNALEDDAGDAGIAIRGFAFDDGYEWYAFLEPSLLTGLDRAEGTGHLQVDLASDRPLPAAQLTGSLILLGPETEESYDDRPSSVTRGATDFGGRQQTLLGTLEPVSGELSGTRSFETVLTMEAFDVIQPMPGQTLLLRLRLASDVPPTYAAEPVLLGGSLLLPLDEYADPIDTSFQAGPVQLAAVGPQERLANPGDVVVLEADITNPSDARLRLGLEVHGQGAAWAKLHTPAVIELAAGATHRAQVVVTVPADAPDADRADLVVEVFDLDDPAVRSLLRFVAHVDTDAEWDDDAGMVLQGPPAKKSPAAPLLVVLALALLVRRR